MSASQEFILKIKKILVDKLSQDTINKYLIIQASTQKLYLIDNDKISFESSVSTSKNGLGNNNGSYKTPLGLHRIKEKIGQKESIYTIFE